MAVPLGNNFSTFDNVALTDTLGLQFSGRTSDPSDSDLAAGRLYYNSSSGALKVYNGSSWSALGGGGGGSATLDSAYDSGGTVTVDSGSVTLNGVDEDTAVLSLAGDGDSAGALIKFAHTTATRNDLLGTGSSWKVTGQGAATFLSVTSPTIVAGSVGNVNLAIDAFGSGTIGIGATSTGAVTITPALTAVASVTVTGAAGSDKLVVTAGDFSLGEGSITLTDDDNAASLSVTNDGATTAGAAADTGVVNLVCDTLTTGTLLHLSLTEGTLNGGFYLRCWDETADAAVFTIGENGDVVLSGSADANALDIVAGDLRLQDGKVAITNADNEDTLSVVNNGLTSASALDLSGSGTFTGSTTSAFVHVSPSGLTSGTVAYLVANAMTTGKVVHVSATGSTDGILLDMTGGGANMTATGGIVTASMGAATVGAALRLSTTGVYSGAGVMQLVASSLTTGIAVDLSLAGLTEGKAIDISNLDAITTGKAIHVDATGITQTSGILVHIDSASTALTGAGRLLLVDHTGASASSAVVAEVASAAADETVVLRVTASAALAAGVLLDLSGASVTTGTILDLGGLDALTTGSALNIVSNSSSASTRTLVQVTNDHASAADAVCVSIQQDSTDHSLFIDHNGATGSALSIDSEGTTQTGGVVDISAAVLTTGTALDIGDLDALTSGKGINLVSNSADTGAFILQQVTNDNALATGALLLGLQQDSTGNSLFIDHNGATGKAVFIDSEGTTQTGGIVDISPAVLTTGTVIDIGDADALTSGCILNLVSNSADATARQLVKITNDHASATGVTPLRIQQDAPASTNYFRVTQYVTTSGTVTLWMGNGTTANGTLSGTAGDILFNGGSNKPEYCSGTTNWVALA